MGNLKLKKYYDVIIYNGLFSNNKRLKLKLDNLFGNLDFQNKKLLDIGGGIGTFSFYAAVMGAKKVVILEPESHGSSSGIYRKFKKIKSDLDNIDNIEFQSITLQEYNTNQKYDYILLYNSINHIDEEACISLKNNITSREKYLELFRRIFDITNDKGKVIICDCARSNFFGNLKVKNPLAPTIEWKKHQNPNTWIKLLKHSGFNNLKVTWPAPNYFGKLGKIFLSNKVTSFLMTSHFCIKVEK